MLPLEQFFPMPDGIIYLDVSPIASVKEKNDNHSIQEMIGKKKKLFIFVKRI